MQKGNLKNGPIIYENKLLTNIVAYEITHEDAKGYGPKPVDDHVRFFFNYNPLLLTVNDDEKGKKFVTERSVIKVQPGLKVEFEMKKGSRFYEVHLAHPEQEVLDNLVKNYKTFFDELTDLDKTEWDKVAGKGINYIVSEERNSSFIDTKTPGLLIAPTCSRFKHDSGTGWQTMYARGTIPLGIAVDYELQMRGKEALHKHGITSEIYVCADGAVEVEVDGTKITLKESDFLIAEPGEVHAKISLPQIPYQGATFQLPSIPGDKYTPEGVKFR
jgi:mannose-6-phosphate isomerase-like protein (cupin superfamily)